MRNLKILAVLSILFFLVLSSALAEAKILIISPHPDDDILISSGVVYRAVQGGETVKVVYMTNGDYNGTSTGYVRQGEAVAAEIYLGMTENSLIFLGYPDGYLHDIYTSYITSDQTFTAPNGQSTTYGNRGLGSADYHYYKFGSHATYNSYNIQQDLESIITDFKPDHIFSVGDFDQYSDHYSTYFFLRLALNAVMQNDPTYNPTVHKTCVWCDPSSWPNPIDPTSFFSPIPADALTPFGLNWNDRESLDVPPGMQSRKYMTNKKFLALSAEVSQGGVTSYGQYIHKDEIFWTENYAGTNKPPVPNAGLDQSVSEGATVQLDGSGSHDVDGDPLSFQWVQSGGVAVQLSDPNVVNPTFNAPTGLKQDAVLTFELVVSDGGLDSTPDSVNVIVHATDPDPYANLNIAPLASITSSSENTASGQLAIKAVDGVIDGVGTYPGDATKEWATNSEKTGAWLQMTWPSPYTVNRVILYDRPNSNDQILSATLHFSDGTSIQVGPLDNLGGDTAYTLPTPITTTSLTMTVTAVSNTTQNVGLAELEVYGTPAGTQNSQTTISSSLNPSAYGSPVTFTATVTAGAFGTVTFMDGGSSLGTVTLPGGISNISTFSTSSLKGGTHWITAVYNGDSYHYKSTSNSLSQTVTQFQTATNLSSSSLTSTYGTSLTFTATVSQTGATGAVTFMDGATTLGTGSLSGGTATYSTSSLAVGLHSITAYYGGDSNYTGSTSNAISQNVNQASTSTTLTASPNPWTYGTSLTFTATVSETGATGAVTFMDGATTLGTGSLSGGTATYSTSSLAVGLHSITAYYGGDSNYTGSTSNAISQNVNQASTSTILTANPSPSVYGSPVTFTATISSNGGTPTGTVTYMDGATVLGAGILSDGMASYTAPALVGGTHSITAVYSGDANFETSTSPAVLQTVNQAPTTATISAPAVIYNANGIVTVAVTSGSLAVTGDVALSVNGQSATTLPLSNGSASFTITSPSVGSYSLSASYAPQGNFGGSSNTSTLTVSPAPTSTSISAPAITYGAEGTVIVTVSSGVLLPTGNVALSVDGETPVLGSIAGTGAATFTIPNPSSGNHTLYATYVAQGNFGASSASGALSVGLAATTTTITPPTTVTYGGNGSVTVTVSSGAGMPSGSVSLSVDSIPLPAQELINGSVTFAITSPSAGSHAVSASFAGQGNFGASSSTATLIVNTAVLTVTATNTSRVYNTANPVFMASYSGFINGDSISVLSGTPLLTTMATLTSPVGTYPIAVAAGSLSAANYSFSFASGTLTVTPASTITSVASSANPSTYGASVILTATVVSSTSGTPTGLVTFKDGTTILGMGSLSGGTPNTATYVTSSLGLGSHSITAAYGGDANFTTSTTSSGFNQFVNQIPTSTILANTPNPSTYGGLVTFTATVTGSGGTPTGMVTFMDGTTVLGTGTLSGGQATYATSALGGGTHSVTTIYSGDSIFASSTSPGITQTVKSILSSTSLSSSADLSAYGSAVTFTAIVTPSAATGTVTFMDGATVLGTGALSGGTVTYATSTLGGGTHSVTAIYSGDANFTGSTSSPYAQTVVMADGKLAGSDTVGITDALKALRIAAGIDTPTAFDLEHGDVAPVVNGQSSPDGKIDLGDVVAILRKSAGLQSW
jgi:LmbE family N-acetylglucosaminyl deacetylase